MGFNHKKARRAKDRQNEAVVDEYKEFIKNANDDAKKEEW